jgi:SAM-dependent methyltransferase
MSSPVQVELTLPEPLVRRCAERARRLHPVSDEAFARAVAETSRVYTRSRSDIEQFAGARWALAARLGFFLPRDLLKVWGPLAALARAGALPSAPTWRVLDLGAGLGATSLGVAHFAARTSAASGLEVIAVDRDDEALSELASLARDAASLGLVPIEAQTRIADLWSPAAWRGGPFHLVVVGLSINERQGTSAEHVATLLRELAKTLEPGGAIIVIEPALRETTRALQRVRDEIAKTEGASAPLHVFWPCPHALPCPMLANERDWCHAELPMELPPPLAKVAGEAGLRDERLTYSALVLRREPGHELTMTTRERPLRLVSAPLFSKGKVEAIGCAPAGDLVRLMRLDRHRTNANAAIAEAHRGDALALAGVDAGEGTRTKIGPDAVIVRTPSATTRVDAEGDDLAGSPPRG